MFRGWWVAVVVVGAACNGSHDASVDAAAADAAVPDAAVADAAPDAAPADAAADAAPDAGVLLPACTPSLPGLPVHDLQELSYVFAVGDFDGDGRPDVVTFDGDDSLLAVTFGRGDGTFRGEVTTPLVGSYTATAAGDLDGDGKPDVVLVGRGPGVQVLLGAGDGTFVAQAALPATGDAHSVAIADFDHDGIADIAVPNGVYFGHGDGTFDALTRLAATESTFMASGDLDGDGNLDLVVYSRDNFSLDAFLGDGAGGFGPALRALDFADVGQPALGDVTHDGIPDLVVGRFHEGGPSTTIVLIGDGTGRFTPGPSTALDLELGLLGQRAHIADLDGDGNNDLVTAAPVRVARGLGDGTFALQPATALRTTDFAFTDIDGDDRVDLVFVSQGEVGTARGDGAGGFVVAAPVGDPATPTALYPGRADFDGDGNLDVPAVGGALLATAGGQLVRAPASTVALTAPLGVVGDFDEDGRPDLALGAGGTLTVALGTGDGSFHAGPASTIPSTTSVLATGDFDGDGHRDVVTASGTTITLARGLGDGTFVLAGHGTAAAAPFELVVADFDQDGRDDVVAIDGTSVQLFRSLGTTFAAPRDLFGPGFTGAAADLDGDGVPDLVIAPFPVDDPLVPGTVTLLFGRAGGPFAPPVETPIGRSVQARGMSTGDLDGDGTVDLLVMDNDVLHVAQGVGDGTFRASLAYAMESSSIASALTFTLLDLDHTGRPAVVSDARVLVSGGSSHGGILVAHQGVCVPAMP